MSERGPAAADAVRPEPQPEIEVRDLTMAFGDYVVQRDVSFTVNKGDIFIIMGGSGCGKSTLLRHMLGLIEPAKGEIYYRGQSFTGADLDQRNQILRGIGVLYQSGGLWSSMTLSENIGLPLGEYTDLDESEIERLASLRLALVGLKGFEDYYPSQISGGMQKRAGLARALALDPGILCIDEPSAGLDPISSRLLDDLIIQLRESLETTVVVVTHELSSIFAIGTNSVFLDADKKTVTAIGPPKQLRDHSDNPAVRRFLTRGEDSG